MNRDQKTAINLAARITQLFDEAGATESQRHAALAIAGELANVSDGADSSSRVPRRSSAGSRSKPSAR